jgi:hypothetical protein
MFVGALVRRWVLPIGGAVALILSAFLPWWKASGNSEGLDWPLNFLWEAKKSSEGDLSVGLLMIALGALVLILTMMPLAKIPRRLVGGAAMLVAVLFARAVLEAQSGADLGSLLTDELSVGFWVALAGGVVLQV